jgi:acyl-lipid omega-6 desaturase (Delta-12 desaturase)
MTTDVLPLQNVKREDFTLKPYLNSNNFRALGQMLATLIPFAALWWMVPLAYAQTPWLLLPLGALMVLFSARCFGLMHDCGHYALFRGFYANRIAGFIFGVVNAIPQYPWSRGHAFHHKHNGNWEIYRGPAVVKSTEEFARLSPMQQRLYVWVRHPLMLFPGGFFYLVIKPRIALVVGMLLFVPHVLRCAWRRSWTSYRSPTWYTIGEFWDILGNNICVIALWLAMGAWLGHGLFWAVYAPVMTVSAAIFLCVFFTQHNFPGSYAHRTDGWSYTKGALEGSSHLRLPPLLNWFTADIAYHSIHHLNERIPNYRLAECYRANQHLLTNVTWLRIRDIPACFDCILWDPQTSLTTTVAAFRAAERARANDNKLIDTPVCVGEQG